MIKRLPRSERPRERLAVVGAEALSDVELLSLVLGCSGVVGSDVVCLARELLFSFKCLQEIGRAEVGELMEVRGIGAAKATRLKAAFELGRRTLSRIPDPGTRIRCSADVARWFRGTMNHLSKEVFWAVGLDSKRQLLGAVRVAEGHLSGVEVHPREAFVPLMRMTAHSAVFVHNHPSGDPEPSQEDIALTQRLVDVGELVGIRVLDHVVVGLAGHMSLVPRRGGADPAR